MLQQMTEKQQAAWQAAYERQSACGFNHEDASNMADVEAMWAVADDQLDAHLLTI